MGDDGAKYESVGSAGCVEVDRSTRLGPISFGCFIIHRTPSEEFGGEHSH